MIELITNYISSYFSRKLFDTAYIGIKTAIKRINENKNIVEIKYLKVEDCIDFIANDIESNMKWAESISFQGSRGKSLQDIFVEIDLNVNLKRDSVYGKRNNTKISLNDLLVHTEKNIVLLGDPGAGKTTSVKKIFAEIINKDHEIFETFNIPLVIKLKELTLSNRQNNLILFEEILSKFGITINQIDSTQKNDNGTIIKHIFREFIERLNVLIILDGFDEISDNSLRSIVVQNLNTLSNSLTNSRFIITSRSADYNINIENTEVYEISSLSSDQINEFAFKWLKNEDLSNDFLLKLKKTPYIDTAVRPLLLANICSLYEKYGDIPDKPKSVYDKILTLLLEDWSIQNSVKRISRYGNFGTERKKEFISAFAYNLIIIYEKYWFNKPILREIYDNICSDYDLPKNEDLKVISEIESHNGLIVQTGIDRYEFSHKSIAEYLVANYLIKMPQLIRDLNVILKIPNEISISISISSAPSFAYYHFVYDIINEKITNMLFLKQFLARILVENPDFESSSPLFALSNICILNFIAKELYYPYDGIRYLYENKDKYYFECIDLIIKLSKLKIYKISFNHLLSYYNCSKQEITKTRDYNFDKWREIYILNRVATLNYMGNEINMPDSLYAPIWLINKKSK